MVRILAACSLAGGSLSIRKADLSDLDAMVDVGLAAMPMDPQWDYRLRYRWQYPEETRKFTRDRYKTFLENEARDWHVMVAELPSLENSSNSKVAAFSVWRLPPKEQVGLAEEGAQKPMTDSTPACRTQRRDADPKRMKAWRESLNKMETHHFNRIYGANQIHLMILATHPDYQRHGAGGNLTMWGLDVAKKGSLAATLFGSPMGRRLYLKLGFQDLGAFKVQVEGETEFVCVSVMAYVHTCDET